MSAEQQRIVGTIKMRLDKFEGDVKEGQEPVETIEREYPLTAEEAVALGLMKGE